MSRAEDSAQVMWPLQFWWYMTRESTSAAGFGVDVLVSCGDLEAAGAKRAAWLSRRPPEPC